MVEVIDESGAYSLFPELVRPEMFDLVYDDIRDKVVSYYYELERDGVYKKYPSKRLSCLTSGDVNMTYDENDRSLPVYRWEDIPSVEKIKDKLEEIIPLERGFDYALIHLYRDGTDCIGYHRDKEALETSVVSLSLGATRKFRFRKIEETKGFYEEILMRSGDVIHMKPGCQKMFKHTVPREAQVKEPRINITFRVIDT